MCEVLDRAEQRGMQRGIECGIERGMERGIEQGRIKMLMRFLTNGGTEEDAIRLLGVTPEEIHSAKEQLK